jgi:hypothetical protein
VPNVAPRHLDALVQRLPHDRIQALPALRGRGRKPRTERMPGDRLRIEPCFFRGPLHDARDGPIVERLGRNLPAAIDSAKDRPLGDLRRGEPRLERAARMSKALSPSSEINKSHNTGRYAIYDEILSRSL